MQSNPGPSQQQLYQLLKQMQNEHQEIASKISELELESREHLLVIEAIEKLDPARKCFRLVGGVLVERTVGEVLPAVKKNRESLQDVIKQLQEEFQKKGEELNSFIVKHKLQASKEEPEAVPAGEATGGVLA